jgi:hypothetical protein
MPVSGNSLKQYEYFNETPNEKAAVIFRELGKDLLERVNK